MKNKFYQQTWFSILMLILFFPIGLFTMWKYTNWNKTVKIIVSVIYGIILVALLSGGTQIKTYSSEITYQTEAIPAQEAEYETLSNLTTKINGEYVIGSAPKDYITGNEKEFTTAQSGKYIAGEDFPAGVYDLVPVSGGGNVQGTGLNVIMGTEGGDFYTDYYDNKEFKTGDNLEVSGVSIKLVPQNKDDFYIPEGTYNLTAVEGGGNVIGAGLNEIMGTEGGAFYVKNYDNADLVSGKTLTVTGVSLELEPKEKEVLVKEATEAVPSEEIIEGYSVKSDGTEETCTLNGEIVTCNKLEKLEDLKEDIEKQKLEEEK